MIIHTHASIRQRKFEWTDGGGRIQLQTIPISYSSLPRIWVSFCLPMRRKHSECLEGVTYAGGINLMTKTLVSHVSKKWGHKTMRCCMKFKLQNRARSLRSLSLLNLVKSRLYHAAPPNIEKFVLALLFLSNVVNKIESNSWFRTDLYL